MKSFALDTETTGLKFDTDKIIEIGCVEMIDGVRTGRTFHCYINPEKEVDEEARRIHGMSLADLKDNKKFSEIADEFLEFIGNDLLVIHNSQFDLRFLNKELNNAGKEKLSNPVRDTLKEARKKWPAARVNLDSLCRKFKIDNSNRTLHGALLDADLLAQVYLEMNGGVAPVFEFKHNIQRENNIYNNVKSHTSSRPKRTAIPPRSEEIHEHEEFVKTLNM